MATDKKIITGLGKERYGAGVLNNNGVAIAKVVAHKFHMQTYEVDDGTLKHGAHIYQLESPIRHIQPLSLQVYKNGRNLQDGRDYVINRSDNTIELKRSISPNDDSLEIRFISTTTPYRDFLLLPRGNFTDEQLKGFLPDLWDVFDLNILSKHNENFRKELASDPARYHEQVGYCTDFWIAQKGIMGILDFREKINF